jgi:hypothetical protein
MANRGHIKTRWVAGLSTAVLAGGGLFASAAGATTPPQITTVAGNYKLGGGYSGDGGVAVNAQLHSPTGVALDVAGSLYISDTANNRVRKVVMPTAINQDIISTVAGNGSAGFSGDGGPATQASLDKPTGVAVDSHGNIYIADTLNNRIREVNTSGTITTIAGGGGACGSGKNMQPEAMNGLGNGGPATKATVCGPTGLALDSTGDVFLSDTGNNEVREILATAQGGYPAGTIIDYAGLPNGVGGQGGDGGVATAAHLNGPTGLAIAASNGNVYVSDTGNTYVRVVDGNGNMKNKIFAFAGTQGKAGFSGDGGSATSAKLNNPTGLASDPLGNVYIADTSNQRIRLVNPSNVISTYAGTGVAGYSGDGGAATSAKLDNPTGDVAANGSAVYFGDTSNNLVRGIFNGPAPVLPQTALAIILPLSALTLGGGVFLLVRKRNRRIQRATIA